MMILVYILVALLDPIYSSAWCVKGCGSQLGMVFRCYPPSADTNLSASAMMMLFTMTQQQRTSEFTSSVAGWTCCMYVC